MISEFRGTLRFLDSRPLPQNHKVYGTGTYQSEMTDYAIIYRGMEKYLVDGDTVQQFTGKKDANGEKIFEGDRVKNLKNNEESIVTYDIDKCAWTIGKYLLGTIDSKFLEIEEDDA